MNFTNAFFSILGFVLVLTVPLFFGLLIVLIVFRAWKAQVQRTRVSRGVCPSCKYDLRKLTVARCPECGTEFDPERLPPDSAWIDATEGPASPSVFVDSHLAISVFCQHCDVELPEDVNQGACPNCGKPFVKSEQIVDEYGPEVFSGHSPTSRPREARSAEIVGPLMFSPLAVGSIPLYGLLVDFGLLEPNRWVFIAILFLGAIVNWVVTLQSHDSDKEN